MGGGKLGILARKRWKCAKKFVWNRHISINEWSCLNIDLSVFLQGVRLGVRPDAPPLPRPSRAVKVETGCNVGNPCISSPCPAHSRCSDQWERHTCICEPGEWTQRWCWCCRPGWRCCHWGRGLDIFTSSHELTQYYGALQCSAVEEINFLFRKKTILWIFIAMASVHLWF